MKDKIRFGNSTITYSIVKSKRRKTSQIIVDAKGVVVQTPLSKKDSEIKKMVSNKKEWIFKKRLEFKGSGDVSYDSDVSLFITVDDDENRTLHCKKDRINERTWTEDITDRKFKDQQPVVVEYRTEVDMPLL